MRSRIFGKICQEYSSVYEKNKLEAICFKIFKYSLFKVLERYILVGRVLVNFGENIYCLFIYICKFNFCLERQRSYTKREILKYYFNKRSV